MSLYSMRRHFQFLDGRRIMKNISLNIQKELCVSCSMALRKFIGKMGGVDSIDVENGKVVINFDDDKITEENLRKITNDSLEKLGYKTLD